MVYHKFGGRYYKRVMHYEYLLLYGLGLKPKDVIRLLRRIGEQPSSTTIYRWHRIYRDTGKRLAEIITASNSVSSERERKANTLD